MSDFFEPPPKPVVAAPRRYRMPPWFGAPGGTLPGVVAFERILAQTEKVAVCVTRLAAYPAGFEFDVLTMTGDDGEHGLDPMMFRHHHRLRHGAADDIPPEMLRLGVQFADGSKATNAAGLRHDRNPPAGPLPPPGPVVLVCELPAMDIALTRSELDAQTILDAAARAQVIFSDQHLPSHPTKATARAWPSSADRTAWLRPGSRWVTGSKSCRSVVVMEIRRARAEDDRALGQIDRATWAVPVSPAPPPPAGTRFFSERTRQQDVLVAEVDGVLAGYVELGQPIVLASHEHVLEISGLAVAPERQGAGVGRGLVEAAVHEARHRGARKLSARVLRPNAAARRLYEACGFVVEGILRAEFLLEGCYVDDVLMACQLVSEHDASQPF